jgi:nucleoside-diphosphate-sugar epimerase
LKNRQNGVPLCILRPAIINNSYLEPYPGWIDSIAAAVALFLFVGLGIVRGIKGDPKNIGDMVPVDVVVNLIIVATAFNFRQPHLAIYNVGSSDRNPITWGECQIEVQNYWNANVS